MPYSSGSFSLTSGNPVVTGTTISSTWANNTLSDIATGLSTAMLKDGSQTLTANIPFNGFQITGLGAGTAATDGATVAQTQNGASSALTSVSGTNTIVGTASPTPSAYAVGQRFWFVPANTNTGATTLNVSSLGAGAVQWNGAALVGGEIRQNVAVQVYVSATTPVFQLIGSAAMLNGYSVPSNVFTLQDNTDRTKQLTFVLSGITTATTRTITMPDANVDLQYSRLATTSAAGASELATSAEIVTGTSNTLTITPLGLNTALGFSGVFTSTAQTITAAGALTLAHGLGRRPVLVITELVAVNSVLGYTAGDRVFYAGDVQDSSSNRGISIVPDATNLNIRFASDAATLSVVRKDTGAVANITNSDWTIVFRCWA